MFLARGPWEESELDRTTRGVSGGLRGSQQMREADPSPKPSLTASLPSPAGGGVGGICFPLLQASL